MHEFSDNSYKNKQTLILRRILFFSSSNSKHRSLPDATIQENCSRRSEVAAKFPEMVR